MIETTRSLRQITGTEAPFCRSAVSLLLQFLWSVLKGKFVCHTNVVHGTRVTREDSTEKRFYTLWGGIAPNDFWEAELTQWPHQTHSEQQQGKPGPRSPTTSDVCQYNVEHERVMFSSVKAAICVWDVGFNSASTRQTSAWVDSHLFSKSSPF